MRGPRFRLNQEEERKCKMREKRSKYHFFWPRTEYVSGTGPNGDRDRQRPIFMDRRSRSGRSKIGRSLWNPKYDEEERMASRDRNLKREEREIFTLSLLSFFIFYFI